MTHEIRKSVERCAKTGTLLGAVSLVAALAEFTATMKTHEDLSDKANVITNLRTGDTSTLVIPGYHADGRILAKNFDKHIEHLGTTHYAVHPEKDFRLDAYADEILRARKEDGYRPANIYALSMGALLFAKLMSDDEFRKEFGPVKKIVIDSGLSGKNDLSVTSKLGIAAGAILPVTYSTGQVYHLVNSIGLSEEYLDYDPDLVDKEEALERMRSTRKVGYAAAKGQILFMHREDIARMDLSRVGENIEEEIIYLSSMRDHLINTKRSAKVHSISYDRPVDFRIDHNRKEISHATGPENPRGVIAALEGKNKHDDDPYDLTKLIQRHHEEKQAEAA